MSQPLLNAPVFNLTRAKEELCQHKMQTKMFSYDLNRDISDHWIMSAVGTALKSTAFDPSPNSYTRLTQPQSFQFKRNCIKKKTSSHVLPHSQMTRTNCISTSSASSAQACWGRLPWHYLANDSYSFPLSPKIAQMCKLVIGFQGNPWSTLINQPC